MNKLEEISKRGRGMRVLVRLLKTAITGCSACAIIVSAAQLEVVGGVTNAFDQNTYASLVGDAQYMPGLAAALPVSQFLAPLDEAALEALFPAPVPEAPAEPEKPEIKGIERPDGWTGSAVTFDDAGNVFLYGTPVESAAGMARDLHSDVPGGTPAAHAPVSDDYFKDALIIGNSLIVGMQKVSAVKGTYYANIGLSVRQFFERPFLPSPDGAVREDGSAVLVTAAEALASNETFQKVYLMFGVNELGWVNVNAFIEQYETIIDTILAIRPDAVIYVQAILPINEEMYNGGEGSEFFRNDRIMMFNEKLSEMAARKQVFYLTPGDQLRGEDGGLPASATLDGVHMNGKSLKVWAEYLKTHTAELAE